MNARGEVILVGAGPGAADLITVRGLAAVRAADVIVYDRLVSTELLREAKPGCEFLYVGKEPHRHSVPQAGIEALLIDRARRGQRVVRLKGGDPFVFGRGGEELLAMRANGIACSVVPGVTSAVAAPGAAGIPVTARGVARGFHVFTAHDAHDAFASIDFSALLREDETCVFLMGLALLDQLARRFIAAGRPEATPVAVISCATLPAQRTVVGTLANIAARAVKAGLVSPAVIVVGSVVETFQ